MKRLLILLAALCVPGSTWALDCDQKEVYRNNQGYTVQRIVLADGKTTDTTSTKCVPPQIGHVGGNTAASPWDFYRFIADEGNTCTSWTANVRDYPINSTAVCRGTCDAHTLATLDKTATTSRTFREPLGEAMDVVTSGVTCSGGVSIFVDFYYRNQNR